MSLISRIGLFVAISGVFYSTYYYLLYRKINLPTSTLMKPFLKRRIKRFYKIPSYLQKCLVMVGVPLFGAVLFAVIFRDALNYHYNDLLRFLIHIFICLIFLKLSNSSKLFDNLLDPGPMKLFPLGQIGNQEIGLTGGQIIDSLGRKIRVCERQENIIFMGPGGAGKSTSFMIPALIEGAYHGDSSVFVDMEGNQGHFKIAGTAWNELGRPLQYLSIGDDDTSLSFNPLFGLEPDLTDKRTGPVIAQVVNALMRYKLEAVKALRKEARIRIDRERDLIVGLCLAVLLRPPAEKTLFALADILSKPLDEVKIFISKTESMAKLKNKKVALYQLNRWLSFFLDGYTLNKEEQEDILSCASKHFAFLRNPQIRKSFDNSSERCIHLDSLFREPSLFYIRISSKLESTEKEKIGDFLLAWVVFEIGRIKFKRKPDNHNIWIYIDEISSLGYSNLSRKAENIGLGGIIATYKDNEKYAVQCLGKDKERRQIIPLLSQFGNIVVLPNSKLDYQNELSRQLTEIFGREDQKRYDSNREELINRKLLLGMNLDEAALFSESSPPFIFNTVSVYRNAKYRGLIEKSRQFQWKYEMSKIDPNDPIDPIEFSDPIYLTPIKPHPVSNIPKMSKPILENKVDKKPGRRTPRSPYIDGPGKDL